MKDCIFCKIIKKEIPKEFRYEDDNVVVFDDISPQAKVHVLIVSRKHIESFDFLTHNDEDILSSMRQAVHKIVKDKELIGKGYKIQLFAGGAQTVDHLHFHLLGPVGLKV
jgi:histidine triad (HIT) family protein